MIRVSLQDASSFWRSFSRSWVVVLGFASVAVVSAAGCVCTGQEIEVPRRPTAQEETSAVKDLVKDQRLGPDALTPDVQARLTTASRTVFSQTFGSLIAARLLVESPVECHVGGCFIDVTFVDRCAQLRAEAFFTNRGAPIYQWPGVVSRTPPIANAQGQVTETWAFLINPKQYDLLAKVGSTEPPPPPPVAACPATRPVLNNAAGVSPNPAGAAPEVK